MDETNATLPVCRSVCPDISHLTDTHKHILFGFIVLQMPLIILTNGIVLVGLVRTKSAGSRLFVIPLCVNDIMVGAVSMPIGCVYFLSSDAHNSCNFKFAIQFISYTFLGTDCFLIYAIGVERLIVLKYPMKDVLFRWKSNRRYVLLFCIISPLCMASISVLSAIFSDKFYIFSFGVLVGMLSGSILVVCCYVISLRHVQNSVRKLHNGKDNSIQSQSGKLRHDMALARSVKVILCVELALHAPYFVVCIYWTWEKISNEFFGKIAAALMVWSLLLMYVNSSANAFIYSYYNRPLRQYVAGLFTGILTFVRRRAQVTNVPRQTNDNNSTKNTKL